MDTYYQNSSLSMKNYLLFHLSTRNNYLENVDNNFNQMVYTTNDNKNIWVRKNSTFALILLSWLPYHQINQSIYL